MSSFSRLFGQMWEPLAALFLFLGALSGFAWRRSFLPQQLPAENMSVMDFSEKNGRGWQGSCQKSSGFTGCL